MKKNTLNDETIRRLGQSGVEFSVRVTPKASRNEVIEAQNGSLRVKVTVVPEGGKANAAVVKLLAKALEVSKSDLTLIRGSTSRDKVFRVQ